MTLFARLNDLGDTQKLAQYIASIIKKGDVVLLQGELGSGKTTFARFFVGNFVKDVIVSSPTFGIVNIYEGSECELWHYDLYRLKHQEEIFELGLDEALRKAIVIIEWPEIIRDMISNNGVVLSLKYKNSDDSREVQITLLGELQKRKNDIKKFIEGMQVA
jgi:tRNA threonylcarbamoyl adenosine modification protein YjeE